MKTLPPLEWAKNGYAVFPCNEDKKPYTKHGFKDATTDPKQITIWWTEWPYAFIAVPTGKETFDVADLDVKNGKDGRDHVPDWETRSNVISQTRTGGYHLYFGGRHNLRNERQDSERRRYPRRRRLRYRSPYTRLYMGQGQCE